MICVHSAGVNIKACKPERMLAFQQVIAPCTMTRRARLPGAAVRASGWPLASGVSTSDCIDVHGGTGCGTSSPAAVDGVSLTTVPVVTLGPLGGVGPCIVRQGADVNGSFSEH